VNFPLSGIHYAQIALAVDDFACDRHRAQIANCFLSSASEFGGSVTITVTRKAGKHTVSILVLGSHVHGSGATVALDGVISGRACCYVVGIAALIRRRTSRPDDVRNALHRVEERG
jgi:hypothetical protein